MEPVDGLHNCRLGIIVQRRCCLVKYQNLRIIVQSPGNTDSLTLPAGKPDTALTDTGIDTFRKRLYKFVKLCLL